MTDVHREYELKFEMADDTLRQFREKPVLREIGIEPPVTRKLRSVYFDTTDCVLRSAGFSLRIRRQNGKWLQTLKESPASAKGNPGRLEIETVVSERQPDLDRIKPGRIRAQIEAVVDGLPLHPVFETTVWRTTRMVRALDDSEVEIALDRGEITAPNRSEGISEAEFELKRGNPQAVLSLAKHILEDEAVRMTQESKASRGYRLADCCRVPGISPGKAELVVLQANRTAGDAFGAIIASCGRQVLNNIEAVFGSDDLEGPHQLRIGLRRLRCALRAHRELLPGKFANDVTAVANSLSGIVGDLRDVDVLIDEFVAPYADQRSEEPGPIALLETLRSYRDELRTAVRSELSTAEVAKFQVDILALLESGGLRSSLDRRTRKLFRSPVKKYARTVLDDTWKRLSRYGRRIERLSVSDRHKMRKALKNQRYTAEFYASLFPKKAVRRHIERLRRLQADFGYLNDVAMARKMRVICESESVADRDVFWTIGHIQGLNDARAEVAWESAKADWEALQSGKVFWARRRD